MQLLIIGATGSFGLAVLHEALERGHRVRALVRTASLERARTSLPEAVEVVEGDAFEAEQIEAASRGVDAIIYGLNVPYPDWEREVLRAGRATAQAAARVGTRIVLPGNVYGLGIPDEEASEETEQQSVSRKGRIRNELEAQFTQATSRGARLLIVRAGDFFGKGAQSSWLTYMTEKLKQQQLTVPTQSTALHEWAYLPDLAHVTLNLLEREEELGPCETFHFRGHRVRMSEMVEALETATARPLKSKKVPWFALKLLSPFWPMAKELVEMRYLWESPVLLSDAKLRAFLGGVRQTPLVAALQQSIRV